MVTFEYSVNGGSFSVLDTIDTAETHTEFYGLSNSESNHGYVEDRVTTVLVHRNTNEGDFSLVVTHDDHGQTDEDLILSVGMNYSEGLSGTEAYLVQDVQSVANTNHVGKWDERKDDGVVMDVAQFDEVRLTLDHTTDPATGQGSKDQEIQDFRIIDGGSSVYAGKYGSITIRVPESLTPISTTREFAQAGKEAVLLTEDLAHL